MKPIVLIAGMALFGGIGGAAYSEYDRVTSSHEQMRAYILHNAKAYKADPANIESALEEALTNCTAQMYQMQIPPSHSKFFALTIATDYAIVNRFGLKANEQQVAIAELRSEVANRFFGALTEELGTLSPELRDRLGKLNIEFRDKREKLAHCAHENAFKIWYIDKST